MSGNSSAEDNAALASVVVVSIFGLFSNGLSLYMTRTKTNFRNAFGILCTSFLICNLQAVFGLLVWCTVVLSVKSPVLSSSEPLPVRAIGVIVNGGWFASISVHFFIAVNRFCAFVYATKYHKLWSESKALVVGIVSWTSAMIFATQHLYDECSFIFHRNSNYVFSYESSVFSKICANVDAAVTITIVIGMACVDFTTLTKIVAYRRAMRQNTATSNGDREKEVLFFKQSCILGLLYISCTAVFNITPYVLTDKWLLFASSTIMWIATQSLDGLTFLIFNRSLICKMGFCSTTITPAVTLNRLQTTTRQ